MPAPTPSTVPPGLLRRRLHEVLDFALQQGPQLARYQPYWQEPCGNGIEWLDKVVTETALLCLLAQRAAPADPVLASKAQTLATQLEPVARAPAYLQKIMRNPQYVIVYGIAHMALTAAGFPDDDFDFVVRRAVRAGLHRAAERIPFRDLDARWLLHLYDEAAGDVGFEEVAYGSILSADTDAFYLTRTDGYAITHSIFYLTDFGRHELPPGVSRPRVRRLVEDAICWTVQAGDLDLLGELLLCAWQLDKRFGPYAQVGLDYFFASWQGLGMLIAPSFDPEQFATLVGLAREAYHYLHTYHTYYVGGLLCAALCESDVAYELPTGSALPPPDAASRDLQELAAITFSTNTFLLPVVQAAALPLATLRSFLLDALLLQAVREYDLQLLATLYQLCQRHHLPPTPLTSASLHYLALQRLADGRLGIFSIDNPTPAAAAASSWLAQQLQQMQSYCEASSEIMA